ncbi:beta-1,3-galactosyltransferase 1 isoform X3 [Passer domesticus]|uniref:beta-1,3-galactosyltransferase 1 isoform X3 n=1 Tax=Passer domesticus TaxID=48849 RepID=UPI0030FE791F
MGKAGPAARVTTMGTLCRGWSASRSARGDTERSARRGQRPRAHGRHGPGAAPAARKRRCRAGPLPLARSRHAVPPPRRGAGAHWLPAVPVGEGELRRCPRCAPARRALCRLVRLRAEQGCAPAAGARRGAAAARVAEGGERGRCCTGPWPFTVVVH